MSAATRVHRRPTSAGAAKRPGSRGGASGLVPALRLTVRRCRFQVLAWVLPLWGLVMAVPSYVSVYPTIQLRGALVEGMRNNPGTRLLYGRLPLPGTIGQLAQWEIGSYLLVCTGLMTVLLTCFGAPTRTTGSSKRCAPQGSDGGYPSRRRSPSC